jgi:hypothetical protein
MCGVTSCWGECESCMPAESRQCHRALTQQTLTLYPAHPGHSVMWCLFLLPPTFPDPQFIQLAGLTGTTATSGLRSGSSGRDASLPGPVPRPPGPVALLGPRQGNLWLVNSLGQPVLLPLTHPGERRHRAGRGLLLGWCSVCVVL